MPNCPICKSELSSSTCECGYDPDQPEKMDWQRAQRWIDERNKWQVMVERIKKIYEFGILSIGGTSRGEQWTYEDTGNRLGKSTGTIHNDVDLARKLHRYPELRDYPNKSKALEQLKRIERQTDKEASPIEYEPWLQSYIHEIWSDCEFFKDWECFGSYYNTKSIGEIDLLARHKKEPRRLVIELKKDQSSDVTIGQILRYMGWVIKHEAKEGEEVEGLIIANDRDLRLEYALIAAPNVRFATYLIDYDDACLVLNDGTLEYRTEIPSLRRALDVPIDG